MLDRVKDADPAETVSIFLDGKEIEARARDTVAAALIAHDAVACRTSVLAGTPRGPYCMMGVCFECLVVIDGVGSRQACMTPVRPGMRIERQIGRRRLEGQ